MIKGERERGREEERQRDRERGRVRGESPIFCHTLLHLLTPLSPHPPTPTPYKKHTKTQNNTTQTENKNNSAADEDISVGAAKEGATLTDKARAVAQQADRHAGATSYDADPRATVAAATAGAMQNAAATAPQDVHAVYAPGRLYYVRRTDAPKPDYVALARLKAEEAAAAGGGSSDDEAVAAAAGTAPETLVLVNEGEAPAAMTAEEEKAVKLAGAYCGCCLDCFLWGVGMAGVCLWRVCEVAAGRPRGGGTEQKPGVLGLQPH